MRVWVARQRVASMHEEIKVMGERRKKLELERGQQEPRSAERGVLCIGERGV